VERLYKNWIAESVLGIDSEAMLFEEFHVGGLRRGWSRL
jgi:hypothetical protein